MDNLLTSEQVSKLLTIVEEATRSSAEGVKYFVEPAHGTLRRAIALRHHIVFGRRGSGKSSLLHKAAADLTVDRAPIAWVDLEPFKGHSYPDLVLSVLIATLTAFRKWLDEAAIAPANKGVFWAKLFGRNPPIGMKLGDDAEEIDLDLTLEKYTITKDFLTKILSNLMASVELRTEQLMTDRAIDRLVLASGGVARDTCST
jgi:hypothetical protein